MNEQQKRLELEAEIADQEQQIATVEARKVDAEEARQQEERLRVVPARCAAWPFARGGECRITQTDVRVRMCQFTVQKCVTPT